MIDTVKFYVKMIKKTMKNEVVGPEEYKKSYDTLASTYHMWLDRMAVHTEKIIRPELIEKDNPQVLDFACGSGYISGSLIEKTGGDIDLTCVDISNEMLGNINEETRSKIEMINMDGMEFLEETDEKFDAIYCGWALPYFDRKKLLKLFRKRLRKNGMVCVICNAKGTLDGIGDIFIEVMKERRESVSKPMNIRFGLPGGSSQLEQWFEDAGFEAVESGDGESVFEFETAKGLYEWIKKTGAIAGTDHIFEDGDEAESMIIEKIGDRKKSDGMYSINHRFTYGIFKLAEEYQT